MENENEVVTPNVTEGVALETTENTETTVEETTESIDELRGRLEKAEQLALNQKIRAEKAERANKGTREVAPQTNSNVSTKDLYALSKANVAEDDISEVEEFAKFKKVSISEALKSSTLKAILKEKDENRNVANASNVGNTKRASSKISDEALDERASRGEMPESSSDLVRLIKFRKNIK